MKEIKRSLCVFPLFRFVSKVLLFSSFPEADQPPTHPQPPRKLPLSTIRGLWSSHCLSVLAQRLKSGVISGFRHVCARMWRGGWGFVEKDGGCYVFSHLPSLAEFIPTRRATTAPQNDQALSCGSRERCNLLCFNRRQKEDVRLSWCQQHPAGQSKTNVAFLFFQLLSTPGLFFLWNNCFSFVLVSVSCSLWFGKPHNCKQLHEQHI